MGNMVVYSRYRRLLIQSLLYIMALGGGWYFIWQAQHGERGLLTKQAYQELIIDHQKELASLKDEHAALERRVSLVRSDSIDLDILEEEALIVLGYLRKQDRVIFLPDPH